MPSIAQYNCSCSCFSVMAEACEELPSQLKAMSLQSSKKQPDDETRSYVHIKLTNDENGSLARAINRYMLERHCFDPHRDPDPAFFTSVGNITDLRRLSGLGANNNTYYAIWAAPYDFVVQDLLNQLTFEGETGISVCHVRDNRHTVHVR